MRLRWLFVIACLIVGVAVLAVCAGPAAERQPVGHSSAAVATTAPAQPPVASDPTAPPATAAAAPEAAPAPAAAPRTVVVASWNIRDFSLSAARNPDFPSIAASLRALHADVCAIIELNDPAAAARLAQEMGTTWTSAATPKVGRTPGSREHYGFVWDTSHLAMVGDVHVDPDPGDAIDREPGWATFRTTDGRLDFTVMAVHITWGSTVGPRQAEIRALRDVWDRTQTATVGDDDLILCGDFNRNVGDAAFDRLLEVAGMVDAARPPGATAPATPTVIDAASTYDQILLSTAATQEWTGTFTVYAFDELLFGNDDARAKKGVSDHRPVAITLTEPEQDDD